MKKKGSRRKKKKDENFDDTNVEIVDEPIVNNERSFNDYLEELKGGENKAKTGADLGEYLNTADLTSTEWKTLIRTCVSIEDKATIQAMQGAFNRDNDPTMSSYKTGIVWQTEENEQFVKDIIQRMQEKPHGMNSGDVNEETIELCDEYGKLFKAAFKCLPSDTPLPIQNCWARLFIEPHPYYASLIANTSQLIDVEEARKKVDEDKSDEMAWLESFQGFILKNSDVEKTTRSPLIQRVADSLGPMFEIEFTGLGNRAEEFGEIFGEILCTCMSERPKNSSSEDGRVHLYEVVAAAGIKYLRESCPSRVKITCLKHIMHDLLECISANFPEECPSQQNCNCSSDNMLEKAARDYVFEDLVQTQAPLVAAELKVLVEVYESHPSSEVLLAISKLYSENNRSLKDNFNELFSTAVKRMKPDQDNEQHWALLNILMYSSGSDFKTKHVDQLETFFKEPDENGDNDKLRSILKDLASVYNPMVMEGRGENYYRFVGTKNFETAGNSTTDILITIGDNIHEEISRVVELVVKACNEFKSPEFTNHALEKMRALAGDAKAFKTVKSDIMKWKKDPMVSAQANALLALLKQNSSACLLL